MSSQDLFMFVIIMACPFVFTRIVLTLIKSRDARHLARAALQGRSADADRTVQLLTSDNDRLNYKVGRLEERIAVLERIATDRTGRLAEQIDALR